MFCPKCGTANPDGSKFCKACGAPLRQQAPGTQVTTTSAAPGRRHGKGRLAIALVAVVAAVAVVAFVLLRVVGVTAGTGSPSSTGAVATTDGASVGGVTIGGTEMGNTASNYAEGAPSVSDGDYDYFYSITREGICRAKNDGSSPEVVVGTGGYQVSAGWLSLDGDRLIYLRSDTGSGSAYTVHSVAKDGSDDKAIYTVTNAGASGAITVQGVYVYDHTVYVLTAQYDSANGTTYSLWTMDEDGSNQKQAGGYTTDGTTSPFVTKDKIYFSYNPRTSGSNATTMGEVYVQNLDGTDFRQIYKSTVGGLYSSPVVQDGKVYVTEGNTALNHYTVTRMDADGSNAKAVYEGSTYLNGAPVVANGSVYGVLSQNEYTNATLAIAPVDGGDAKTASLPPNYFYPRVCTAGDHLLLVGTSDGGYTGTKVCSLGFDGTLQNVYVAES